ncbi:MAG TPA: glycosyltransferase [Ornithinibacter sp.]|nr:glycosyltransferase [Ornithinibacter sp.]
MAEIVVVTWDGGGNVPPAFAIARELAARGHGIRVLGHRGQRATIERAGFPAVPSPEAREFAAGGTHPDREMIATFGDRGMGRDLAAELRRHPADLVVVDALMFGALDAARRSGTPYAVLEHFYDTYFQELLRGPLGLVLRARGLGPARAVREAALRVVASLPELDPVRPGGTVRQVGPVVDWNPRVDAEPTVLVSLSTFGYAGMAQRLQDAVDACSGLPARVVVTTGPHVDPTDLRARGGVEVHRFVPHADLMPRASVFVGHGGHGSAMAALAHDVPVVVLPVHPRSDHRVVGRSIERAGAGRLLPGDAGVTQVADAVRSLLADGRHRVAAATLGARVRACEGAAGAADALEAVLPDRHRVARG